MTEWLFAHTNGVSVYLPGWMFHTSIPRQHTYYLERVVEVVRGLRRSDERGAGARAGPVGVAAIQSAVVQATGSPTTQALTSWQICDTMANTPRLWRVRGDYFKTNRRKLAIKR